MNPEDSTIIRKAMQKTGQLPDTRGEAPKAWRIEYGNDTGPGPDGDYFEQWWTVTNDDVSFRFSAETDAKWLLSALVAHSADKERIAKLEGALRNLLGAYDGVRSMDASPLCFDSINSTEREARALLTPPQP